MEALGGTITVISMPDPPQLPFSKKDPQVDRRLASSKIQQPPG